MLHKTKISATMNLFQETFPAFFFLFFFYSRHFILPKSFSNSLFLLFFLSRSNSITVLLNNIRLYCNQLPATFCCCCCVKKNIYFGLVANKKKTTTKQKEKINLYSITTLIFCQRNSVKGLFVAY